MSEDVTQRVVAEVAVEPKGDLAAPFQTVADGARKGQAAVDQFMQHGSAAVDQFRVKAAAGFHHSFRSVNMLTHGLGTLGVAMSGAKGGVHQLMAGMMQFHAGMQIAHGITTLMAMAQNRHAEAANKAAAEQHAKANADNLAAIAAAKVAAAEGAVTAARDAALASQQAYRDGQISELELSRELAVAKGKEAAAQMGLARAQASQAAQGGAMTVAGGGTGLMGMAAKALPLAMFAGMGISLAKSLVDGFFSAAEEREKEHRHRLQTAWHNFQVGISGHAGGTLEHLLQEQLQIRSQGFERRQGLSRERLESQEKREALALHPDRFRGDKGRDLQRALEAEHDVMSHRVHGLSWGEEEKRLRNARQLMSWEMGLSRPKGLNLPPNPLMEDLERRFGNKEAIPEELIPPEVRRRQFTARRKLEQAEREEQFHQNRLPGMQRAVKEQESSGVAMADDWAKVEQVRKDYRKQADHWTRGWFTQGVANVWSLGQAGPADDKRLQEWKNRAYEKQRWFEEKYAGKFMWGQGDKDEHFGEGSSGRAKVPLSNQSPMAELIREQEELAKAMERTKKAQEDVLKAELEKSKAIQGQLKEWHKQQEQQEQFYHQAVRQMEDRIQSATEKLGSMTHVDRQATANILDKLKAGKDLTREEEKFAGGNVFLEKRLHDWQVAKLKREDPELAKRLLTDQRRDLGRAKDAEKHFAGVKVEMEKRINIMIKHDAEATAEALSKKIEPKLAEMDALVEKLVKDKIDDAFRKWAAHQHAGKGG